MIGVKRVISILAAAVIISCGAVFASSCAEDDTEKTYDVAIRVSCTDGKIYEFPVGTNELSYEIPYTGKGRDFTVEEYQYDGRPGFEDLWITPNMYRGDFSVDILFYVEDEGYLNIDLLGIKEPIERGKYILQVRPGPPILDRVNYNVWTLNFIIY